MSKQRIHTDAAATLERCNSFWFGPRLGPVERACLRSVLAQGHRMTLWCYDEPDHVPADVEIADAARILPRASIIRHKNGSVSLFSNWFRYELQRREAGIWLDADVYLLKPIPDSEYILAREPLPRFPRHGLRAYVERMRGRRADPINSAVLRVPANSPLLPPLLELFEQKRVPDWIPVVERAAAYWRLVTTGRTDLSRMPWGVAGPKAVTALASRLGLSHLALPSAAFHPFSWTEADWILQPYHAVSDRITDRTIGIHLWNERIKGLKEDPAPTGSFLARLQAEGA